jgi:hypothetical protein
MDWKDMAVQVIMVLLVVFAVVALRMVRVAISGQ